MTRLSLQISVIILTIHISAGCTQQPPTVDTVATDNVTAPAPDSNAPTSEPVEEPENPAQPKATSRGSVVKLELSPNNTAIEFVGTHIVETKPDPNARHGKFGKFKGTATFENDKLASVSVEIETASISTENPKLTGHLKNADFFDVREFPTASFTSTAIESSTSGKVTITGDLKILKTTQSITFEATTVMESGFVLDGELTIDRTQFGMNFGPDKVEKMVTLKVHVEG